MIRTEKRKTLYRKSRNPWDLLVILILDPLKIFGAHMTFPTLKVKQFIIREMLRSYIVSLCDPLASIGNHSTLSSPLYWYTLENPQGPPVGKGIYAPVCDELNPLCTPI